MTCYFTTGKTQIGKQCFMVQGPARSAHFLPVPDKKRDLWISAERLTISKTSFPECFYLLRWHVARCTYQLRQACNIQVGSVAGQS